MLSSVLNFLIFLDCFEICGARGMASFGRTITTRVLLPRWVVNESPLFIQSICWLWKQTCRRDIALSLSLSSSFFSLFSIETFVLVLVLKLISWSRAQTHEHVASNSRAQTSLNHSTWTQLLSVSAGEWNLKSFCHVVTPVMNDWTAFPLHCIIFLSASLLFNLYLI